MEQRPRAGVFRRTECCTRWRWCHWGTTCSFSRSLPPSAPRRCAFLPAESIFFWATFRSTTFGWDEHPTHADEGSDVHGLDRLKSANRRTQPNTGKPLLFGFTVARNKTALVADIRWTMPTSALSALCSLKGGYLAEKWDLVVLSSSLPCLRSVPCN